MTQGGMLYIILVLATFAVFSLGVGSASWRQTRLDSRAAATRAVRGLQPAE